MAEDSTNASEKFWTTGRVIATAVVAALIATLGYTLIAGDAEMKTDSKVVLPGTPISDPGSKIVPRDFAVPTLDGRTFKLSEYRGKVLVVDFWATWCPPCREEVPQLVRIAEQNRARGLEVIGLHIDDRGRSKPEDIRRFISQYGINYPVGLANDDMFIDYLGEVKTAIPQTLVFDRSGKVVAHFVSYNQSHARALDEAVNRALAGS